MNVKALTLIFLVVFATAATVFVVALPNGRTAEENVGFTKSHGVVQIDNGTSAEPNGEIDNPGMPG
jgi:hypothetical protein